MAEPRLRIAASAIALKPSSEGSRVHPNSHGRSFDRMRSFSGGGPQGLYQISYGHPVVRLQRSKASQVSSEGAARGHLRRGLMLEARGKTGFKGCTCVRGVRPASNVPGHCRARRERPPDDRASELVWICFYTGPAGNQWGQCTRMGLKRFEYSRVEMQSWRYDDRNRAPGKPCMAGVGLRQGNDVRFQITDQHRAQCRYLTRLVGKKLRRAWL
jgi:hypothetical protein